jgi:hypothetical protein
MKYLLSRWDKAGASAPAFFCPFGCDPCPVYLSDITDRLGAFLYAS